MCRKRKKNTPAGLGSAFTATARSIFVSNVRNQANYSDSADAERFLLQTFPYSSALSLQQRLASRGRFECAPMIVAVLSLVEAAERVQKVSRAMLAFVKRHRCHVQPRRKKAQRSQGVGYNRTAS